MNKIIIAIIGIGIIGVGAYALLRSTSSETPPRGTLVVTTSFYPLYFFSKEIGQDNANIQNITPTGAEPHDYEPTPQDIARIEKSDLLIINGGGLEAWAESIRQNIDTNKTRVVVAGEGLTTQKITEEGKTIIDPHVWLSPTLAMDMVDKIETSFADADPNNASLYKTRAEDLKNKLGLLDQEYRQGLSQCATKDIITSHAAFGYLAATYGLNQVAITGISPDAEPSVKELADIVKFAKENAIKYIFFEDLVSPKLAETLAREVGAQTLVLNPLEGLSDEQIRNGKNYFTEMRENLSNLKTALQCT